MDAPAPTLPIVVRLAGEPKGKARPRFDSRSRRAYSPKKTRRYEAALGVVARLAMRSANPVECPVFVIITAGMPIPKSFSKSKRAAAVAGRLWPAVTPDADNIAKCKDALNKIVWKDDKQVVGLVVLKVYDETPGLRIVVREAAAQVPRDEMGDLAVSELAPNLYDLSGPLSHVGGTDA